MSFARTHSILIASGMLVCSLSALADTPTVKSVTEKPQLVALAGTMTRPAVLTDVHTAFTDGDLVGALHSGAGCNKLDQREWSDLIKQRIEAELPRVFNDEMSKVGGLLAGPKSNGAPLQVKAFLNNLDIQVCQAAAGKWQGGFYVQVGWQIVSPDSGQTVYQASTEGSFMSNQPQQMPTVTGLREAFGVSVRNLLADRRFAAMLQPAEQRRLAQSY